MLVAEQTLLNICELIIDCEHKTAPTQETGYPSIRTPNIGRGRLILEGVNRVSEETYREWSKRAIPQAEDLILAREAPVGNVAIIPKNLKICLGQRTVLIRPDKNKVCPMFLVYCMLGDEIQSRLLGHSTGATVSHLNMRDIRNLELPKLPRLPTQRKIAAVLSAYDDLIENNTRRIKILEEMASAIYREWFVEFRFPGHEQVPMVESELGLIPQGWEVVVASEAISINPRVSVPRHTEKPFVPMKSAIEHSMLITEVEQRTGNSGAKFKNHDTLFARITPCLENGRTGFVQFLPSDDMIALGSTEFIVLRSKTLNPYFVYLLAQTHDFKDNAVKSMTGATGRQRVVNQCFDNYFLPNPDQDSLRQFECIIAPLFKKVQNLWEKNTNLRQTRDLLLPKLISGEIDVSELDIDID